MKTKTQSCRWLSAMLGIFCFSFATCVPAADLTVGHLTATNGLAAYGAVVASTNLSVGGSISIGTATPDLSLTVDGNAAAGVLGVQLQDAHVGKAWFALAPTANGAGFLNQGDLVIRSDGGRMDFNFWGVYDAMVIQPGYVGIGTTAPTEALDVSGNIRTCGRFIGDGAGLYLSPQGDLGMGAFINGMPAGCGEEALTFSAANQFNAKMASGQFTNIQMNLKGLYEQAP